jgi:hypothetical protein
MADVIKKSANEWLRDKHKLVSNQGDYALAQMPHASNDL